MKKRTARPKNNLRIPASAGKTRAYDHKAIEGKWQKKWSVSKIYKTADNSKKKKSYILDMFPYPSGEGLHVGHPKGYIATDIISRMKRMQGHNVLHPMGFDAFGLPAENYAIQTKTNPDKAVKKNVARYKKQLEILGFDYDWSREINTTDPKYYKWTQWIFLQLLKRGLAYESYEPINWCPVDKTGLANEDVENGRCERCGTLVEKKLMRQWVLKITDYAEKLLAGLDEMHTGSLPHVIDRKNVPVKGKKYVERRTVHALVRDPKTGKFLGLKWHKFPWTTFIVGGVENGEDLVEAAKREVAEETGYTDIKFVRFLGGPVKGEYYAAHKDVNRVAITTGILFELVSDKKTEISQEEKDAHDTIWMDVKDMNETVMTCAELPIWLGRLELKEELTFENTTGEDKVRPDLPFVERNAIMAIVKHWKEDKYIGLEWKTLNWKALITGGPEGNQTQEEAALAEIIQETGYTSAKLIRKVGKVHAKFFHPNKNVNRHAHFDIFYFELQNGERNKISADELAKHEVKWIPKNEMLNFITPESNRYAWTKFAYEQYKGEPADYLLDWPASIKEAQRNWIGKSEGAQINFRLDFTNRKQRFVLIHGYEGSAHTNFIPWLKKEFENRGYEVQAPELPNSFKPTEAEQVEYVLKNCTLDENTVIIGHSLGSVVAMKAIMKLNKPVSGLVVVAAAIDPAFHGVDSRPYEKSFDWNYDYKQINKLTGGRIAVLSDTQEKLRGKYLKQLARDLDAILIETKANDRHFCAEQEPAILECCTPQVSVFTTRPDTLYGVTYVVMAPEHNWVRSFVPFLENKEEVEKYIESIKVKTDIERTDTTKEKTGVQLKGLKAVNPANNEEVPVWIADYVLADYGTGAVMGVPKHDERDRAFAEKFNLPITDKPSYTGPIEKVTKYKLHEWVFSRQRYWGEPIPVIHCKDCGIVPVPEKDLPVKLPPVKSYEPTGTGESPLAAISKWVNVKCPKCKGPAKRETNTMPQWAGSSWYYLRYEDPKNNKKLVDSKKEKYWSPVDIYVGGAEHATRHLIYARFWHKFLKDIKVVSTSEPFTKLQSVGLIMGEDGRKMSKRYGNVVNPDDIVKTYGADTLRVYEMFMGPFDQQIAWNTESIIGSRRFIERVWKLAEKIGPEVSETTDRIIHKTIKKVTDDIGEFRFNTAVSTLMIAVNEIEKIGLLTQVQFEILLKLLAPFAPHVAEEIWFGLGNKKSIHISAWPKYDPKLAADDIVTIVVQVNGKVRGSFTASVHASLEELGNKAQEVPEIKRWLTDKQVHKVIAVPGRLVNIVAT